MCRSSSSSAKVFVFVEWQATTNAHRICQERIPVVFHLRRTSPSRHHQMQCLEERSVLQYLQPRHSSQFMSKQLERLGGERHSRELKWFCIMRHQRSIPESSSSLPTNSCF